MATDLTRPVVAWTEANWAAFRVYPQPARDGYVAECERQAAMRQVPFAAVYDAEAHANLAAFYADCTPPRPIPFPLP